MERLQLFETWAPPDSVWSRWAKPALFAEMPLTGPVPEHGEWSKLDVQNDAHTVVVIDLPGAESIKSGLALASDGYRPVPLFNAAYHPNGIVEVETIARWLRSGAEKLGRMTLPPEAPPAFLLDSQRLSEQRRPTPGQFDNRWVVLPQDFPSANFLRSQGLNRVLLFQPAAGLHPQSDLAHVLLRWQEAKIELFSWSPQTEARVEPLHVHAPSRFRSLWHAALAVAGLRRNSAGGFGSIVPMPSQSSGGRFG
jgi:hypothetical protein